MAGERALEDHPRGAFVDARRAASARSAAAPPPERETVGRWRAGTFDRATARSLAIVLALALPVLALRLVTPYELQETDQGKQSQYVLDVVQNGNWLAPGCLGAAATKPPLLTWLAALVTTATGRLDETTIQVPSILAGLGTVLVTWDIVRRLSGPRVAAAAAVSLATSYHFLRIAGLVRTDGLLGLMLAAQVLVYVRSIGRPAMPWPCVAASSLLCTAACLAKGYGGLLSSGVVALHLWLTDRRHRIAREAAVPAAVGAIVLGAWFVAADSVRDDVSDVLGSELLRHTNGSGFPNLAYYLLTTPLRLAPWVLLLPVATLATIRALRRRGAADLPPLVSLALAWVGVHLVTYSVIPHQRPDLIYPAEPAVLMLVALCVRRRSPAWAPVALTAGLALAAGLAVSPLAENLFPHEAPASTGPIVAAVLAGGALVTWRWRRDAAAACFAGLAAAGLGNATIWTIGDGPSAGRASYAAFGERARAEAQRRGVPLLAAGFDKPAPLFDLRISTRPRPPGTLAGSRDDALVVTIPAAIARVERAIGPCTVIDRHIAPQADRTSLVLLARR